MKEHKYMCLFVTILIGILISCGAALAAWNISEYAVNILTISSYKNSIQEKYERPDHVDPGQKVVKEVNVKNEGNIDSFVRIKIDLQFGRKDAGNLFVEEKELDTGLIEIHYNTDLWELRKDGYWYYKDVLRAGESTQKPLLDSYYLSEKADNRYKNKEARILVNMESIQAEGDEMKTIWGIEEKDLGIVYQPCTCEEVTTVTFGKDHKLVIGGNDGDLFANFKNLMPGCSRSQTIHLFNAADEKVTMFLRAESVKQNKMNRKKMELVQQLLKKYAVIEIREENKVLYSGPVDGNLEGNGWNMAKDISLGSFLEKQGRNLVVKLTLDADMDSQYQALLGKVKWVFSVRNDAKRNEEKDQNPSDEKTDENEKEGGSADWKNIEEKVVATAVANPKTGDETEIAVKFMVLFGALLCMAYSWRKLHGKEKNR